MTVDKRQRTIRNAFRNTDYESKFARIERSAATGGSGGGAPIGAIVAYAGTGDPPEGEWLIADGRLIDRNVYASFFARVGHAYNNNIDPGSNKVKLPDKRGKKSVGALNMGSALGAGPVDNAHVNVARGASGGEVNHTLDITQMPSHSHRSDGLAGAGGVTGNTNPAHTHTTAGNGVTLGSGTAYTSAANLSVGGGAYGGTSSPLNTTNIDHAHGINAQGGGLAHNNLDPYEADSYIVRVA